MGIDVKTAHLVQVPHHGSRHNVSSAALDALLGPIVLQQENRRHAFVSAPRNGGPKHPSKRVMNAFLRRGTPVTWNQTGGWLHFNRNGVPRNWWPCAPQSFFSSVEAVED
jgi:beta-lactamase superfamily II metal-dependent hydrolase